MRLIWGGDATVEHIRALPASKRCVDICFPDRYSLCILAAKAINEASQIELEKLISNFYNDVYLFDQNACSSPHLILWQGEDQEILKAKENSGQLWIII